MAWKIGFSGKAAKQAVKLPKRIRDLLIALTLEIQVAGPVRGNWLNYSKLGLDEHHCHLTYSYVVCWRVLDKKVQIAEVYYVGNRENAPY